MWTKQNLTEATRLSEQDFGNKVLPVLSVDSSKNQLAQLFNDNSTPQRVIAVDCPSWRWMRLNRLPMEKVEHLRYWQQSKILFRVNIRIKFFSMCINSVTFCDVFFFKARRRLGIAFAYTCSSVCLKHKHMVSAETNFRILSTTWKKCGCEDRLHTVKSAAITYASFSSVRTFILFIRKLRPILNTYLICVVSIFYQKNAWITSKDFIFKERCNLFENNCRLKTPTFISLLSNLPASACLHVKSDTNLKKLTSCVLLKIKFKHMIHDHFFCFMYKSIHGWNQTSRTRLL